MTSLHHTDTTEEPDTRALLRRAADELAAAGLRVSVRAVRERVGRGSTTTIAQVLREWRISDLANRMARPAEVAVDATLPPGLAHEAHVLYLRVLAQVGVQFSTQRAADALSSVQTSAQQLAALDQVGRLADFGAGVASELVASVEERAKLTTLLAERDALVAQFAAQVASLTDRVAQLVQQLADTKLAAAEREALALTRVDGLSKHLLRMTEEQRTQLAAPITALRERYEALQTRESVMSQQLIALREETARLKGQA